MKRKYPHVKRYKSGINFYKLIIFLLLLAGAAYIFKMPLLAQWNNLMGRIPESSPQATLTITPAPTPADTAPVSQIIEIPAVWSTMLDFGVFTSEQEAHALAQQYTARGAAGYVLQDGGKYHVIAAGYDSAQDAAAVQKQMLENHGVEVSLYTVSYDKVELSVNANRSQIDALTGSYAGWDKIRKDIHAIYTNLDSGNATLSEATDGIAEVYSYAAAQRTLLQNAIGNGGNEVVDGLQMLYQRLETDMAAVIGAGDSSHITLSSKLKHINIDMAWRMISYMKDLTL